MGKKRGKFNSAARARAVSREEGMQFLDDATTGNLQGVIQFVEKYGKAGLEVRDRDWAPPGEPVWQSNKKTALMFAAWEGFADVAGYLVAQGADVNVRDRFGRTPLMLSRDPAVTSLLLDAGAKIADKCLDGRTALMRPSTAEMIKLLVSRGAEPDARDTQGQTALMLVAEGNRLAGRATVTGNMAALLDAGADIDARDKMGRTALMHAATRAVYIRDGDGDDDYILNRVKWLVGRGADPELRDNDGYTAEMLALRKLPAVRGNIEQQQEVGVFLAEAAVTHQDNVRQHFIDGSSQNVGIMKPLLLKR